MDQVGTEGESGARTGPVEQAIWAAVARGTIFSIKPCPADTIYVSPNGSQPPHDKGAAANPAPGQKIPAGTSSSNRAVKCRNRGAS